MSFPSTLSLQNKTAIVTGGTRGIGKAISIEFARRGADVAMVYTNASRSQAAAETVSEIEALGRKAVAIQLDLSELSSSKKIVEISLKDLKSTKIDIIVHNATHLDVTPTTEVTHDIYAKVMDVGVRAPFMLTQAALPHIPSGGRIIFISSTAARNPVLGQCLPLYAANKGAIEALSRTWAQEFGHSRGITVNVVAPGFTETDILLSFSEEVQNTLRAVHTAPIAAAKRTALPDDISQVVAFVASDSARWITGQTLSASGGMQMI